MYALVKINLNDTQVLAMKPFEAFANLSTDEFAERFSSFLRVDTDNLSEYKSNLAFLVSIFFFNQNVFHV